MNEEPAKDVKEKFFKSLETNLIGMCGGNINSDLWFCGIEWTDWIDFEVDNDIQNELFADEGYFITYLDEKVKIPYVTAEWEKKNPLHKSQFDQKIAKIILSYSEKQWQNTNNHDNSHNYEHYHDYMKTKLYTKEGKIFKLNLFPLPAKNFRTWAGAHYRITECSLKREYQAECIKYRFPILRELARSPINKADNTSTNRIIVCIGLGLIDEFILAFWGKENYEYKRHPKRYKQGKNNEGKNSFVEIEGLNYTNQDTWYESNGDVFEIESHNSEKTKVIYRIAGEIRVYRNIDLEKNLPVLVEIPFISRTSDLHLESLGVFLRTEL